MSIISDIRVLFADWIAAVSTAVESVINRFMPSRRIMLIEGRDGSFTMRAAPRRNGSDLPETVFCLMNGLPSPSLPAEWTASLRGSRIEFRLSPDKILLRPVDFPRQASEFLDGMIRAQIDRLTPWSSHEVAFGWSEPRATSDDRIHLTLAATSKQTIEPFLTLARDLGARAASGVIEQLDDDGQLKPIKMFDVTIQSGTGSTVNIPSALRLGLLGAGLAAVVSLAMATYVTARLDLEQQQLQSQIAARRTALRLSQNGAAGSAQALLVKRKQTTPATVMVLESISKALPDGTYVTELRVEGDKVQIVGLTQDAPPLIRLIEQSPQFTRATFFAPTTRSQNESGERFHIEAHIKPYFGASS